MARFSARDQAYCCGIFQRLVTPERTRAVADLHGLTTLGDDSAAMESIVHQLAAARLLQVDTYTKKTRVCVELVHESLIER